MAQRDEGTGLRLCLCTAYCTETNDVTLTFFPAAYCQTATLRGIVSLVLVVSTVCLQKSKRGPVAGIKPFGNSPSGDWKF